MAQKIDPTQLGVTAQTTAGKNGAFIRLGDVVISYGYNSVSNAGTTINLPYPYTNIASIQATTHDPNNWPAWVSAWSNASGSSLTLKQAYTTSALNVFWMVIGN